MIYIVRHGETNWNLEGRYQGSIDVELNEKGRNQALEIKAKLKDVSFDEVISSPLKRAFETAEIISGSKDILTDTRLIERKGGELEGKLVAEVFKMVKFNDPEENRYKIENMRDFQNRVFDFCKYLEEISVNKNILVVTHAGVCIYMRCYFENGLVDEAYKQYRLNNCEFVKYESKAKKI